PMGAFLDKPVVNKVSGSGQLPDGIAYGHSTMQGWRTSQEDAHACAPGFDASQPDRHLFAVFDGHGGAEVALYLAKHLPQYLLQTDTYQSGDFEQALKDAFLGLDAKLLEPEVAAVLKSLAKSAEDDSESDQDAMAEEASALREEADMPLDRLLRTINAAAAARRQRRAEEVESAEAAVAENENNENTEREAAAHTADSADNGVNGSAAAATAAAATNDEGAGSSSNAEAKAAAEEDAEAEEDDKDYVPGEADEEEEEEEEEDEESKDEGDEDEEDGEEGEEGDDDEEEDSESEESDESEEYEVIMPTGDDPGVDSGTTAVVALMVGDRLFVANAGDSRAVLSDAGVAVDMSDDHKPEDEPERQRIETAGGHVTKEGRVNGGLNLSRAIGDHAYKQNSELTAAKQIISPLPDVRSVTITDSHRFLLLACDGIWNSMSSQEAVDFCEKRLSAGLGPEQVCEALFDHCLAPNTEDSDGTGCDNMTAVLVRFHGADQQQAAEGVSRKRQLPSAGQEAEAAAGAEASAAAAGESESKRAKEG
ncbi:hypothetical protein BOX15_Mlig004716g2, partial [Macrostomum lignano]